MCGLPHRRVALHPVKLKIPACQGFGGIVLGSVLVICTKITGYPAFGRFAGDICDSTIRNSFCYWCQRSCHMANGEEEPQVKGRGGGKIIPDPKATSFHCWAAEIKTYNFLSVVQNTTNPLAGSAIAPICACVIRGGSNPLLVDFTSSIAELSGSVPSVFIATWPFAIILSKK